MILERKAWTRQELVIAFAMYCRISFGKLHSKNPEIVEMAERLGRTPGALAMKLCNIASLDPAITSTGRKGLGGASAADKAMWEEAHNDWQRFAVESEELLSTLQTDAESIEERMIHEDAQDYSSNNRIAERNIRIGQGFFRRAVLSSYNYKCCITGLPVPTLLVASHIVPWHLDPINRLNPSNGLALSMLHDKAFDLGIITINDDMTVRVSSSLSDTNGYFFQVALAGYAGKKIAAPEKFLPHSRFLHHHREAVYENWLK